MLWNDLPQKNQIVRDAVLVYEAYTSDIASDAGIS